MEILSQSRILLCLLAGLLFIRSVTAYSKFLAYIPNGHMVPNPCRAADGGDHVWIGVGHLKVEGGGARNAFGKAFQENGNTYNRELCKKDSDGDGRSNGEELGDPECNWKQGHTPLKHPSGHPGVCEPVHTHKCRRKNSEFDIHWSKC